MKEMVWVWVWGRLYCIVDGRDFIWMDGWVE